MKCVFDRNGKTMKTKDEVLKLYGRNAHIENRKCPECGGILVTTYGMVIITSCVEVNCYYSDYDYDFTCGE